MSNQIIEKIAERGFNPQQVGATLLALGEQEYPGYNVAPTTHAYNSGRPAGIPTADTLLRAAALPSDRDGWEVLTKALTGRGTPSRGDAQRRSWERGRQASAALPRPQRQAPPGQDGIAPAVYQPPMGLDARLAIRPLIEWGPTADGTWDYVKVGEYTVWELT